MPVYTMGYKGKSLEGQLLMTLAVLLDRQFPRSIPAPRGSRSTFGIIYKKLAR